MLGRTLEFSAFFRGLPHRRNVPPRGCFRLSAAPKQMDFGASFFPKAVNIELASEHDKCLRGDDKNKPMKVHECTKHGGQPFYVFGRIRRFPVI